MLCKHPKQPVARLRFNADKNRLEYRWQCLDCLKGPRVWIAATKTIRRDIWAAWKKAQNAPRVFTVGLK